jgi:hypothetical protein
MYNWTVCGAFVVIIGFIALVDLGVAYAQVEGAVQYPPPSVGEDAQPPPPARMVPKIVLPRRLELGISGSSQPPANLPNGVQQGGDRLRMQPAPHGGNN